MNLAAIILWIVQILFLIAILIVVIIGLWCCFRTKADVGHLHRLKSCEALGKGTFKTFFKHFDEDFVEENFSDRSIVCLDGQEGKVFKGKNGLKDLFYFLRRLQQKLGDDFFTFGNTYAPADSDDTCVLVIDYDCEAPKRKKKKYDGKGEEVTLADDDNELEEEDDSEDFGEEEGVSGFNGGGGGGYRRRRRRRSPCKDCHAFVHFHLNEEEDKKHGKHHGKRDDDKCDDGELKVESAHICFHDIIRRRYGYSGTQAAPEVEAE